MQDTTNYDPAAVAELVDQAAPIVENALTACRATAAKYGDRDFDTAHFGTLSAFLDGRIRELKWDKNGDGTVPNDLRTAGAVCLRGDALKGSASSVRRWLKKDVDSLDNEMLGRYQGDVRYLIERLAAAREALDAYNQLP